jgi:hypothetical protein
MARTVKTDANTDDLRMKLLSDIIPRALLSQYLGGSYDGNRDLYTALGYMRDESLCYEHYYARYARQDITQRIIDAPVAAAWRNLPKIVDGDGEDDGEKDTVFEKEWRSLIRNRKLKLSQLFQTVDKFTGLGRFAILVLGYEGDNDLSQPVVKKAGKKLAYIRAYGEGSVSLGTLETNITDPRYGMPKTYNINNNVTQPNVPVSGNIHHSRVIHVIDGLTESPVYGVPRLKCVFNRLMDLEKVAGGCAEMYWRGARPGMQFNLDPDSMMTTESKQALKTQIDEYENNLRRILRTQGVEINELKPQVSDPEKFIDAQILLISGATGIPKRILTGSERGELASTQDTHNWNTVVHERRTGFCEPGILVPFIERMIEHGVLSEPEYEFYTLEWPDLFAPSDQQQAEVSKLRSEALMMYSNSLNGEFIIPPEVFVELILGFSGSKLNKIVEALRKMEGALDEQLVKGMLEEEAKAQKIAAKTPTVV